LYLVFSLRYPGNFEVVSVKVNMFISKLLTTEVSYMKMLVLKHYIQEIMEIYLGKNNTLKVERGFNNVSVVLKISR
jgi:hypothetical protein